VTWWRTFWYGLEIEPTRLRILRIAFFGVLGLDLWQQVSHAPRYGAGGMSVPHISLLSALPAPHRDWVLVLFCLGSFLAFRAAMGVAARASAAAVAALFGLIYFWSQVDSYQHHYLVWMIVLLAAFVPWEPANGPREHWAVRLLLVQLSLVYLWAAVAKMDPHWLEGRTLSMQISKEWVREGVMNTARAWEIKPLALWSAAAWSVMLAELTLAVCLQVRRLWPAALVLGLGFHIGIEVLGYKIGLFSAFMVALYSLLLPARVVAWCDRIWPSEEAERRLGPAMALSLAGAAATLALPFPPVAALAAGVALFAGAAAWSRPTLPTGIAQLTAGLALVTLAETTDQARDYYKYLGGDTRRRGEVDVALDAYENVLAIDPEYVSGWVRLGDLMLRRGAEGDDEAAVEAFETALDLAPRRASSWSRLARARAARGELEAAAEAAERALELDPEEPDARAVLRRLAPSEPNP